MREESCQELQKDDEWSCDVNECVLPNRNTSTEFNPRFRLYVT